VLRISAAALILSRTKLRLSTSMHSSVNDYVLVPVDNCLLTPAVHRNIDSDDSRVLKLDT